MAAAQREYRPLPNLAKFNRVRTRIFANQTLVKSCQTVTKLLPSTIVSHRVPGSGLPARAYPPRPPSLQLRLLVLVLVLILLVALLLLALVVGLDAVALHHLELRGDLAQARLVVST